MTGPSEPGYSKRLSFIPMLRSRRDHEWQPMRRNYGVKKSNGKSRRNKRYENDVIQFPRYAIHVESISCDGATGQ